MRHESSSLLACIFFSFFNSIHYFHRDHNAPCFLPAAPKVLLGQCFFFFFFFQYNFIEHTRVQLTFTKDNLQQNENYNLKLTKKKSNTIKTLVVLFHAITHIRYIRILTRLHKAFWSTFFYICFFVCVAITRQWSLICKFDPDYSHPKRNQDNFYAKFSVSGKIVNGIA